RETAIKVLTHLIRRHHTHQSPGRRSIVRLTILSRIDATMHKENVVDAVSGPLRGTSGGEAVLLVREVGDIGAHLKVVVPRMHIGVRERVRYMTILRFETNSGIIFLNIRVVRVVEIVVYSRKHPEVAPVAHLGGDPTLDVHQSISAVHIEVACAAVVGEPTDE